MKKVIRINRAKWRTGGMSQNKTGIGSTQLLNDDGYKCCLGFICQQQRKKALPKVSIPYQLECLIPDLTEYDIGSGCIKNTNLADNAIGINDSPNTTQEQKEHALLELFKNSHYQLEFYGEPKKC